jgi:hypothetical protein
MAGAGVWWYWRRGEEFIHYRWTCFTGSKPLAVDLHPVGVGHRLGVADRNAGSMAAGRRAGRSGVDDAGFLELERDMRLGLRLGSGSRFSLPPFYTTVQTLDGVAYPPLSATFRHSFEGFSR